MILLKCMNSAFDQFELPKPARHLIRRCINRFQSIITVCRSTRCDLCILSKVCIVHSAKYVVDEMQELVEVHGAKDIAIVILYFVQINVHEICDEILARGLETKDFMDKSC